MPAKKSGAKRGIFRTLKRGVRNFILFIVFVILLTVAVSSGIIIGLVHAFN